MAYVKGRGYVKTGYTKNQKEVAKWVNLGHTHMRIDPTLRGYAINPLAQVQSHWYVWVKFRFPYPERDLGGGRVELKGRRPGGPTRIYRSRFGITIVNIDRDERDRNFPRNTGTS